MIVNQEHECFCLEWSSVTQLTAITMQKNTIIKCFEFSKKPNQTDLQF